MYMKALCELEQICRSPENIIASNNQTLRGMNFEKNLNTHKPETMMVFKKAATRQAD